MDKDLKVIFYDGECGFCNRSVQFILEHEKNHDVCFTALQSDFALDFFARHQLPKPDLSTVYFWDGRNLFSKSTAALKLTNELKFPWGFLKAGYILPRGWRDRIYDFIAARRHRLGNKGFCALPTEEQRKRFLK
ncbi:MAG: hypothetical protein K0R65_2334 [Crocinitomicaceae bacterium]|jgi:predicted DCC family thiol-disulfide oxidoreductase YuxK|nr:hypothetical protein [Crocinitomicaceae bacterium]